VAIVAAPRVEAATVTTAATGTAIASATTLTATATRATTAATPAMTAAAISAASAPLTFVAGFGRCGELHRVSAAGSDLGGDDFLVAGDIVGIDFAIMIDVEKGEEAIRVALHLVEGQSAVMIAVGLGEPIGEAIVAAVARPKWLAHRADEQATAAARDQGRD
jgi:hypothetical protein